MVEPADVQERVDESVRDGKYPDRKAAIAGLTKRLIEAQKGAFRGLPGVDPVVSVEKVREERWKSLLEKSGGDDNEAARLYFEELKKIAL
jgi:hypothetical protein